VPGVFPGAICSNVVSVVGGTMTFIDPDTHQPPFSVLAPARSLNPTDG